MNKFLNEDGQGMVEYILIIVFVAVGAFVAFKALGGGVASKTNTVANELK